MKRYLALFLVFVGVLATPVFCQKPESDTTSSKDPWRQLEKKQAWILLDIFEARRPWYFLGLRRTRQWTTSNNFDINGKPAQEGHFVFPKPGDCLRLTDPNAWSLMILDFRIFGEDHYLVPPSTRGQINPSDHTGLALTTGAEVIVQRIDIWTISTSKHKALWALVSPP